VTWLDDIQGYALIFLRKYDIIGSPNPENLTMTIVNLKRTISKAFREFLIKGGSENDF
jgi:hypothetical protein